MLKFLSIVYMHTYLYSSKKKTNYYTVAPAIMATSNQRLPALSAQFQSRPFIFPLYFNWLKCLTWPVASKFRSHLFSVAIFCFVTWRV